MEWTRKKTLPIITRQTEVALNRCSDHANSFRTTLTTIVRLVSAILAILFPITFPQQRNAAVVGEPTPELHHSAVGHAGFAVSRHVEEVRAGTGVAVPSRGNQT